MAERTELEIIKKHLRTKELVTVANLENNLILYPDKLFDKNVSGKFLLIRTTADSVRQRDFMQMIRRKIISYVLNYSEHTGLPDDEKDGLLSKHVDLYIKAREKFQTKSGRTGETGELILFLLLEAEGISQIISKMRLKTDNEWPFHGVDAIHLEIKGDKLIFHYGESKMRKKFETALSESRNSIENFENDSKNEDIEFDLISTNIDKSRFENFAEEIVKLVNPYTKNKEHMSRMYSVFLGFDWDPLKYLSKRGEEDLQEYIRQQYEKDQPEFIRKVVDTILASKLKDKHFKFYILPFQDEENFRCSFTKEL